MAKVATKPTFFFCWEVKLPPTDRPRDADQVGGQGTSDQLKTTYFLRNASSVR